MMREATAEWKHNKSEYFEQSQEEFSFEQPLKKWSLSVISEGIDLGRELWGKMQMNFVGTMLLKYEDQVIIDMKLQIRRIIRLNSSSDMNSPSEGMFKDYPASESH